VQALIATLAVAASSGVAAGERVAPDPRPMVKVVPVPVMAGTRPAPEVAALAASSTGSFACSARQTTTTGKSRTFPARLTVQLELGGAWLHTHVAGDGVALDEYRTYDATARQWSRVVLTGSADIAVQTSLGAQRDGWTWRSDRLEDHEQRDAHNRLSSASWLGRIAVTCGR
jgi:hypothetical protein